MSLIGLCYYTNYFKDLSSGNTEIILSAWFPVKTGKIVKKVGEDVCTLVHAIPCLGNCPGEVRPNDMMECHLVSLVIRHDMIACHESPG